MAEPVIDVSSVTISPTNLPCAVYGNIFAYDKLDSTLPTYELYQRDAEHAELISELGQALSVVGLDKILFMQKPVISLSLKVKDNGDEDDAFIARGTVDLDITTNNDYEEVKQSDVRGDFGHATVNYIALSCALVGHITLRLSNYQHAVADDQRQIISQQDSDLNSSLFGSIFAHYGKTFGRTDNFCIPLLNVSSNQSIPLFCEEDYYPMPTIKLTRNYVAVPAYSSLNIKANLRPTLSNMPVVDDNYTVKLWPNDWRALSKIEDNEFSKGCPDDILCTWISWEEPFDLQPSLRQTKRKSVDWGGEVLFELFSVFIGRESDHDLNVFGTITLEHYGSTVVIFKRDESNPDKLLDGRKLLTITSPSSPEFCSSSTSLTINVELKDADQGFLIEEGSVDFDTTVLDGWNFESQFDRPLCSVLWGDSCYCAVHYTMFKSAARVSIKIVLLCKGVDVAKVHGKIVAWSDIFDYTRDYDKKYYQRVLYDEPDDQLYYPRKVAPQRSSLDEHKHGEVELLESCVAVPLDFRFNIGVDLYASSCTRSGPAEVLHKTLSFMVDETEQTKMTILGEYFDLHIRLTYA